MSYSRNEHTIASTCEVRGRGYWSGREVRVRMHPAAVGTGIRLVRSDLAQRPSCAAHVAYREDAAFRTNLRSGAAHFAMVEHLMAALFALEIDNCLVEVDAEELPGLDGSSQGYVDALRTAGLIVQARMRPRLFIREPLRVEQDGAWIEATPSPAGVSRFEYRLSYDDGTPIPAQVFAVDLTPRRFANAVADARTFVTAEQADRLRASGIAAHVTDQDLIVWGADGPIANPLRYPDECARHKTLDLVGDLALAAVDLVGHFVSFRGGHRLNGRMASRLVQLASQRLRTTRTPHSQRAA